MVVGDLKITLTFRDLVFSISKIEECKFFGWDSSLGGSDLFYPPFQQRMFCTTQLEKHYFKLCIVSAIYRVPFPF